MAVKKTAARYSIIGVRSMIATLYAWIEGSEETLDNEESKDYPNGGIVDALTDRIDSLQAARAGGME